MKSQRGHLSAELAQAFLDGRASEEDVRAVEEHVHTCAECKATFEAWQGVYARLGHLAELQPSVEFAATVMDRFRLEASEVAAAFDAKGHLTTDFLLEYLDGQLPGDRADAVRAHLAACSACTKQETEWGLVLGSIQNIGHLEPSVGFQDSVLAAARIGAVGSAVVPFRTRAVAAARGWVRTAVARVRQRDRRSMAVLAGLGTAPAVVAATLGWVVLTHPLVTTSGLARFALLKVGELADGLISTVIGGAGDSALLYVLYSGFEIVASAPGTAALGGLALLILMAASAWVLYRNLAPMRKTLRSAPVGQGFVRVNG